MVQLEALERYERCPRLCKWEKDHLPVRARTLSALYSGVEAGLEGQDPKNAVMAIAANPGLDIQGQETYSTAVHIAHLAEILTAYLKPAWTDTGHLRRVVLVDRWSEDRKMQEIRSWRTMAPICREDAPMLLNFLTIGQNADNRRVSAWTRGWTHPRNNGLRFKKKDGESLGEGWNLQWRERSGLTTDRWLACLQRDRMFEDLVHSVKVSVPRRRDEYLKDIERIEREIAELPENPPMRRSGCYGFSPCQFREVCHGPVFKVPADCGWVRLSDVGREAVPTSHQVMVPAMERK